MTRDATRIAEGIAAQRARIEAACSRANRSPDEVTLIAASKTHPVEAVEAALDAGVRDMGESYVQDWAPKRDALAERDVRWHFIGHLQSNKAKDVAGEVAMVHSVDRKSLVKELAKRADAPTDVLLQVNVSGEASKFGCAPGGAAALLDRVVATETLVPRGLMTMAPYADDPETSRPIFRRLATLAGELRDHLERSGRHELAAGFTELSMGMSGDLEVAVEEGATLVRVGTAIFGERGEP